MTKKNFLEDIVERTFNNLDIIVLTAGTSLLFPTAATIATLIGGAYLVADAVGKRERRRHEQKGQEPLQFRKLQEQIDAYIDRYKLEIALKLHEYGLDFERIKDYLDRIIRREDITTYIKLQPEYV